MSTTTTTNAVGGNVRRARRAAGLTQRELAEELGLEPITVSRWERGVTYPSIPVLGRVAAATETTVVDLVRDETNPGLLQEIRREISDVRDLVETLLARASASAQEGGTS
jgi:transcriptional regulator with XRE-family HTH domain